MLQLRKRLLATVSGCLLALSGTLSARASERDAADCAAPPPAPDPAEPAESAVSAEPAERASPDADLPPPVDPGTPPAVAEAAGSSELPEPAPADAPPPDSAAEALGRTPARVKCLDESLIDESGRARRRKGVQVRPFRKARRVAIALGGGGWAGDLLDTNWHAQANVAFWATEGFGLDVDFKLTPMTFRLERSATGFTDQNRYPDGIVDNFAYVAMGHLLLAPLHTKQRAGKDRVRHGDFVIFAGGGRAFHDAVQGIGFDLGMSLYWYVARFVSVRIDVSDAILATEAFGSRRISNNLVFSTGVALWIPFRRRE